MEYFRDFPFADRVAANRRLVELGRENHPAPALLFEALALLPSLRAEMTGTFDVVGPRGPITWHDHEGAIWAVGESLRQLLKRRRGLRNVAGLWTAIEQVCQTPAYGKGRETFTMLLGQYGGLARVPVLLALLDDPEVAGHALYALRLLGAPEGREPANRLLEAPQAWVRAEARKYLEKLGPSEPPLAAN
jgi:hypothetical protein